MSWFLENLGTILISLALMIMVGWILYTMIRDKKKGKSPCGCDCGNCGGCGCCHRKA